ncbi:MAG: pseudouridine synthase [Bifidobacteriaceae bacterium]|jgi:tRNA pseudouridine32 synthase/23S rRNA pseudouridine746 synthase|nr:pseudouridine synthase [Bifidobacteriaceae bacterium]
MTQRNTHHRYVTDEPDIPFRAEILFENARVIVIDKPHFLATTPRGMWYRSSALMRLREEFHNDEIIPAHRLDRATAGVILFVKHVNDRGAYQMKFQNREVSKTYECLAPIPDENVPGQEALAFPLVKKSRIVKERSVFQAYEAEGIPNAETRIEISENQAAAADFPGYQVYRLHPKTGKTHQLRVHMNSLGLPIKGDDLYPQVVDRAYDDFSSPLHLVARTLEMDDPITGAHWKFESQIPA